MEEESEKEEAANQEGYGRAGRNKSKDVGPGTLGSEMPHLPRPSQFLFNFPSLSYLVFGLFPTTRASPQAPVSPSVTARRQAIPKAVRREPALLSRAVGECRRVGYIGSRGAFRTFSRVDSAG